MPLAIMSAMNEEIAQLVSELQDRRTTSQGMRAYHQGTLWGVPVVLAFSRWGKVAAATTATHLISSFNASRVLFTGVAGGVAHGVDVGDIVVGTRFCQHDMDARPMFERHEVPLLGASQFRADPAMSSKLETAARAFLRDGLRESVPEVLRREFGIREPQVLGGLVASGDQFFASRERLDELRARLPEALCVEMEGAAVAQVCHEYRVPFGIVRVVSDSADEQAPVDFPKFIEEVARRYSHGIIREWIQREKPGS